MLATSVLASNLARLPPTAHGNCSEAVCLATRTSTIAIIFVKYREVSTDTILLNFIGSCRDSIVFAFWQRQEQKRQKAEAYIKEAYVRQALSCFNLILPANQNDSPGQPKESLRVVTAVRYNYYVQGGNMNCSDA